ncbi:Cytochrome P450 2A13 [Nibea albiflora]|uniref:Cytochrome P450 2A13 n=1 Tax=Nibea albiflora TaxID=240163 RepID=A0ACB7EHX6_NIBAL|nr:Cytochrome P450 2A13 [Nibea albiflora]
MDVSVTVILAGLILALLWLFSGRNSRKGRLPPGPAALPLIGNLAQLQKDVAFKSFVKLSEIYGPVMTLYLGWQRTVVLVGYDAVKEALVDQADDFTGRAPMPFLMKISKGYGLATSNGERFRQLRRFTLTTLKDFGMGRKGMEEWIQEESKHMTAQIDKLQGKPFDPRFLMRCTVSNVICCIVFGQRFSYDDKKFLHLLDVMSQILAFNNGFLGQMYNIFPWIMEHLPGQHQTIFARIEEVREFLKMKIQEHKDTLDPNTPRDYIDCFLIRMDQEKDISTTEFHYDNLISTVMNLFLAGTETTSSTITYAINVLIKHPDIQEKMQQEIDTVIGRDHCPKMEDRKSLPFTDAGTVIITLLHSVLKEEKQWASPLSFNPQHFLDQNGNFKKNPAFLPFAAGKRACVGEALARMELFIFTVSLVRHFTFSYTEGPDGINLIPEYSGFDNWPRRYRIIATPRHLDTWTPHRKIHPCTCEVKSAGKRAGKRIFNTVTDADIFTPVSIKLRSPLQRVWLFKIRVGMNVTKRGFMFKQWKERYIVLTMEGSLMVCRDAESPPDQVVALQTNCESVVEGRAILDLPKLPPGGRRDCCFALIMPQNKFLLLLTDNPDDCKWGLMSPLALQRQCSITPCITDRDPLSDSSSDKDPGSPRVGDGTPPLSRVTERGGSFRDRGHNQASGSQRALRSVSMSTPHRVSDCLRHGNSSDARAVRAVCLLMGGTAASSALGYLNSCSPSSPLASRAPEIAHGAGGFSELSAGGSFHACSQDVDSPHFNSFDFEADSDFDAFDCGGFAF